MSPRKTTRPPPRAGSLADRLALELGHQFREERSRRGWTQEDVGRRVGLTGSGVQRIEAGARGSLDAYARLALALGLTPTFTLAPRMPGVSARAADAVHSAMGEVQAGHLRERSWEVLLDEPYQHYQYAGRADVLALDRDRRALLHVENRTRFPDLQAFAGSYNAKRAYLAPDLARRLGIGGGFRSVTHVVAALWTAEVLHVVRLRGASFAALCPDSLDAFASWWDGQVPAPGESSTFVLFDPLPGKRRSRRRWVGLAEVARVEARHRGYSQAAEALRRAGRA